MTLITIIFALLLERMLSMSPQWRAHGLVGGWMNRVDGWMQPRVWSLVLYVLVPVAIVAAMEAFFFAQPGGQVLILPFALMVLLACLGPRDLVSDIHRYEQALEAGDVAAAQAVQAELISGPGRSPGPARGRSLVAACLIHGHERWHAILLWFFVLGLPGAVAYKVLAATSAHLREQGRNDESQRLAETLHGAMAWPSAHITVFLYAMAGSTDDAWDCWKQRSNGLDEPWVRRAWPLLAEIGQASMARDVDSSEVEVQTLHRALALLGRSLLLCLAGLALLTVGGWVA